jgi:hypothetical protein
LAQGAESTVQGLLDEHFHVDRATYLALRKVEKDTSRSLASLISSDSFQNYKTVIEWEDDLTPTSDHSELYKKFEKDARESYRADVESEKLKIMYEPISLQLHMMALLQAEASRNFKDPTKMRRDKIHGLAAAVCHIEPSAAMKVKPSKLRRLFAEAPPFFTGQYSKVRTEDQKKVLAEKTLALTGVTKALMELKAGKLNGVSFGHAMRGKNLRKGILALADGEQDFLGLSNTFESLDKLSASKRKSAGTKGRQLISMELFTVAREFLEEIGVTFGKIKIDGHSVFDPTEPRVPPWDFVKMNRTLELAAKSLLTSGNFDDAANEEFWGGPVALSTCQDCVHHLSWGGCRQGRSVEAFWDVDLAMAQAECEGLRRIPVRLRLMQPTKNQKVVGSS